MRTAEIRRRFLDFFAARDHLVVPSASLVATDPTLLLVNAGMVPFKPYFLGEQEPPAPRAASCQKVVRTVDLDNVGRTARHLSFFQMNGNFSFGDYFKERAIPLAWELLTTPVADGGLGFAESRLWVTVYDDDDEAERIWTSDVGVSPDRVQRRGKEDNYWDMGVPGPCGPCSEIYVDRGPAYGPDGGPVADEDRYLEVWNLVFMQYVRGEGRGKDYPITADLPAPNIDTGMGVERVATLLQGVDNVYETDLVRAVLDRAAELTGRRYGREESSDVALRVVADHVRTATMLVADGVVPGNEGRGYVLRRMLRRVVRTLRVLGLEDPALGELVRASVEAMGPSYPELAADAERVVGVAKAEEGAFAETLRTGTALFASSAGEARRAGHRSLSGERVFQLHDTHGFPVDLTREMAAEAGLSIDEEGFRRLMAEQRDRAQADARRRKSGGTGTAAYRDVAARLGGTTFTGYTREADEALVVGLLADGQQVDAAAPGDVVDVVLDRTPFYAEAGGQLADRGRVVVPGTGGSGGVEVEVTDVQRPVPGLVVHRARVVSGELVVGAAAQALVDVERRRSISRAHTATHLVHSTLRALLGDEATQAGSENAPGRLRFDFRSGSAVAPSVLRDAQDRVNAVLAQDLPVRAFVTTQEEARRLGALALFGEKYGDAVRVVEVGDVARELCGGTHATSSGQVGVVQVVSEGSIGAGVRRVEALVGLSAARHLAMESVLLSQVGEVLGVPAEQVPERVAAVVERLRDAERTLARLRAEQVVASAPRLAARAQDVAGVALVATASDATTADDVRRLALAVRDALDPGRPGVAAITGVVKERPVLVLALNPAARATGLAAGALVREASAVLGGGGGGAPEVAQGGGTDVDAVPAALDRLRRLVAEQAGAPVPGRAAAAEAGR